MGGDAPAGFVDDAAGFSNWKILTGRDQFAGITSIQRGNRVQRCALPYRPPIPSSFIGAAHPYPSPASASSLPLSAACTPPASAGSPGAQPLLLRLGVA